MTKERLKEISGKIKKAQELDEDIDLISDNIEDIEGMIGNNEIGEKGQIRIYLYDEDRVEIGSTYIDGSNIMILKLLIGFKEAIAREKANKEVELQGIEI